MADQNSRQDENQFPAIIAHTGTAGTSETVRLVATAAGALNTTATLSGGSNVNVVTGTQQTLGTVGVLNAGSVVITTGTVTTGSLSNVATLGTIQNLNTGTLAVVAAGSHVHTAGTVTTQIAGTMTALASGTITAGTVRVNWRPTAIGTTFGTLATAAGSAFGTLVAASGAGTEVMVTGCSIVCQAGTPDVRILIGTAITGLSVLAGGAWVPGGGIRTTFTPPIETAANSEITYHFVNAGTAFITLQYYNEV